MYRGLVDILWNNYSLGTPYPCIEYQDCFLSSLFQSVAQDQYRPPRIYLNCKDLHKTSVHENTVVTFYYCGQLQTTITSAVWVNLQSSFARVLSTSLFTHQSLSTRDFVQDYLLDKSTRENPIIHTQKSVLRNAALFQSLRVTDCFLFMLHQCSFKYSIMN